MVKTIKFENQSVEVDTSAGWLYVYRNQFGNDILQDVFPLIISVLETLAEKDGDEIGSGEIADMVMKFVGFELTTVYNIFWALAVNANEDIEPPLVFFKSFDKIPLDVLLPEIFTLVVESSVSSKNAAGLLEQIKTKSKSA